MESEINIGDKIKMFGHAFTVLKISDQVLVGNDKVKQWVNYYEVLKAKTNK